MIKRPRCVVTVDEIGASLFGRMSHKGANANELDMRGFLLEMYSRDQFKGPFGLTSVFEHPANQILFFRIVVDDIDDLILKHMRPRAYRAIILRQTDNSGVERLGRRHDVIDIVNPGERPGGGGHRASQRIRNRLRHLVGRFGNLLPFTARSGVGEQERFKKPSWIEPGAMLSQKRFGPEAPSTVRLGRAMASGIGCLSFSSCWPPRSRRRQRRQASLTTTPYGVNRPPRSSGRAQEATAEIAHEQRQRNDDLEGLRRAQAQTAQDLVDAVRAVGGMGCCRK